MFTPSLLAWLKSISTTPHPEFDRRERREQRFLSPFPLLAPVKLLSGVVISFLADATQAAEPKFLQHAPLIDRFDQTWAFVSMHFNCRSNNGFHESGCFLVKRVYDADFNRKKQRQQRFPLFLSVRSCSIHYTTPPGSRCLGSSFLKLNSARMLWHDAVRNAFLQIQMANLFSARLVGRFISESRFSLWVQRRFRK